MNHKEGHECAVSPVIGTILLVAITVILIAIITATVMGLINQPEPKQVGLTVSTGLQQAKGPISPSENTLAEVNVYGHSYKYSVLTVMIYGGKDVEDLVYLNASVEGSDATLFFGTDRSKFYASGLTGTERVNLFRPASVSASDLVGTTFNYLPIPIPGPIRIASTGGTGTSRTYTDARVVITGTFTDGTVQVLYDSKITINPPPSESQTTLTTVASEYATGHANTELYWLSPKIVR